MGSAIFARLLERRDPVVAAVVRTAREACRPSVRVQAARVRVQPRAARRRHQQLSDATGSSLCARRSSRTATLTCER